MESILQVIVYGQEKIQYRVIMVCHRLLVGYK